jgi:Cu-processing system ATP-binding protein
MIEIKNLQKKFGKLHVLKQVSASFAIGKSYAVIGPNGSGKTTFIKCVLGMVIPDSGVIEVNGQSIFNQWDYRNQIGYMPQIGRYPDTMKIGQLFEMMRDLRPQAKEIDEELIEEFGLTKLFDKRMHTLSGGTRQKVSAALAFLFAPPILILDEPTAGLDPLAVEILKAKIQKERTNQKLFLITSHILSDLDELSSDVIYLDDGSVLFNDTIAELKDVTGEIRLGAAIATIMKRNLTPAAA